MKVIEDAIILKVECQHPDDSSAVFDVAVENIKWPYTDEEEEAWKEDIIKTMTERFNPYGYWHELKITGYEIIDGMVYDFVIA